MKKRNEKGFFLSETIFVISVVAVVLLIVYKTFSSVYYGFLESENYNTVNAINALYNIQKYYESIGEIDTSGLSEENTYIDFTNEAKYASNYYTRIKEEFNITGVYLIDLGYFHNSNDVSNFPVLLRRYLKTLKNVEGVVMVISIEGNQFSYVKINDSINITLNGDEEDEYGVYVNTGGTFVDPGYTGWNGDVPQTEWENGKVLDTNTPGIYYLHYDFGGYLFRRKVEVGNYNASFSYTGSEQEYVVNAPGYYKVEVWGAQGGYDSDYSKHATGAYTAGTILLTKEDKIYIRVGQAGSSSQYESFNGGGRGGNGTSFGYSGGGATDIRYRYDALYARIMVAAGGGGTGGGVYNTAGNGSYAGGLTGYAGGYYSGHTYNNQNGKGGTQVSGGIAGTNIYGGTGTVNSGVFGSGGSNLSTCSGKGASGGGGGYYGGGGGGATASGGSGNGSGGGSSYISGHTGCVAIASSSSTAARTGTNGASCATGTTDNLCSIHYSGMKFIDTVMIDGAGYVWTNTKGSLQQMPNPSGGYYNSGEGHLGDGYAKITYIGTNYTSE